MKKTTITVDGANEPENETLTISELARKHLNDPTHTTTDDEMRNAKVELTKLPEDDVTETQPASNNSEKNPDEALIDTTKDSVPNPYDVLGS